MKKKKKLPRNIAQETQILQTQSAQSKADVLGSYTGTDADGEAPEQDVDDL